MVTVSASFKYPAVVVPDPPLTTVVFNLIFEVAIAEGTVNLVPNVTVMVPPTGIAVIPVPIPVPEPETVIVY
jgi:hypothetical protein